jgi:hypothetical protein
MSLLGMHQGEAPTGAAPALGRSMFLFEPGGQDYVGANSYDETADWIDKESS